MDRLFHLLCFLLAVLPLTVQRKAVRLAELPPFERAVEVIKYFEGMHAPKHYPYIGFGHRLLPGEKYTYRMTRHQAEVLLRRDLLERLRIFKKYGKDALLLAVLSYNVGVGRLKGYGKHPKSRLIRKIESGDRDIYNEYVAYCHYKGKRLKGLLIRRKVEYYLFYIH